MLVHDAEKYKLDNLAVLEKHSKEEQTISTVNNFMFFTTNKPGSKATHRTGILIRKDLRWKLQRIIDTICTAEIQFNNNKLKLMSIQVHTLENSEEDPQVRWQLYEIIEDIISKTPKRDFIILAGDFIAKAGSWLQDFKENIDKTAKGMKNKSGQRLLETCKKENLIISNALLNVKKCHRTTWTAPYREYVTKEGGRGKIRWETKSITL